VKEARIQRRWTETRHLDGDDLTIEAAWQNVQKNVAVRASGADIAPEAITYRMIIPPQGHWSTVLTATTSIEGTGPAAAFVHPYGDVMSPRDQRRKEWVAKIPVLQMGNRSIERTLRRS
jgi:hypothetical protein